MRRRAPLDLLIPLAQLAIFVPVAWWRFVDGDEGVYAYAARLASQGKLPYRDFFYEQMPLAPYVYGGWRLVFGESWHSFRLLSALLAAVAGALLYAHVRARVGQVRAAIAVAAYALSGLVFGWLTVVKTFALATALLVAALVVVERAGRVTARWLVGGALVGLAVDTRLVVAAALPAFVVVAARRRRALAFAAGAAAALVPAWLLFLLAPRQFVFDNLGYHLAKGSEGLGADLEQKARTAANLLGFGATDRAAAVQLVVLVAAAVVGVALRGRVPLAGWIAVLLALGCFAPTPTYAQYFAIVVPFVVVAAAETVPAPPRAAVVLGLAGAVFASLAVVDLRRQRPTSPVLRPSIASVERVANAVDRFSRRGETVLSSWPGYLIDTHAEAPAPYTNQFAPVAASHLSPADARRYRVASERDLEAAIRERIPRLVVYRNWVTSPPFARWDAALRAGRYRAVATVETARIYER